MCKKTNKIINKSNNSRMITIMKANNKNRRANRDLNCLLILLKVLFTKLEEIKTKLRTNKNKHKHKKMTMKKIMVIKINRGRVNGETNFRVKRLKGYFLDLMVKMIKIQKLNREKIHMNKKVKAKRRMAKKKENGEKK